MENFKEFQGKSLDDAIRSACAYYDAPREKLEIDIVQDAKNGIFGLVGARKAVIKARRTQLKASVGVLLGRNKESREGRKRGETVEPSPECAESARPSEKAPDKAPNAFPEKSGPKSAPKAATRPGGAKPAAPCASRPVEASVPVEADQPAKGKNAASISRTVAAQASLGDDSDDVLDQEDVGEDFAAVPFAELDSEKLIAEGRKAAENLITPILGPVGVTVTPGEGRLDVHVECGEDSGLLIGREGQTLAALQYLASRIVSRAMDAPVRLQFDVGDYRERQDERLRELALSLAERVRASGRSCSTRPLSSYHRRIIHLTLQNEPDVQTRSSGDGPLKRVIVLRRRPGAERRSPC